MAPSIVIRLVKISVTDLASIISPSFRLKSEKLDFLTSSLV